MRGRVVALDLSGQAREAVQQLRLLVAAGDADGFRQRREFAFRDAQQREDSRAAGNPSSAAMR